MATRLQTAVNATVSIEIPLKADGNIATDTDQAASQKAYSMNFFNGSAILSAVNSDPENAHSLIETFCSETWGDIFSVFDYDTYSIKAKVELVTEDS